MLHLADLDHRAVAPRRRWGMKHFGMTVRRAAVLAALMGALTAQTIAPAAAAPPAQGPPGRNRSAPPDRSNPRRPVLPQESGVQAAAIPAPGVVVIDPAVDNTVPNFATTDTTGGTEPSVARNPADPNEI